jgi:uncharacterized protein
LINKRKIINDPVYGFISIPGDFIYDLVEHPWFQRLRNIKQLGLSCYVYPSAVHTRFQHSLGSMYLTTRAIGTLRAKGVKISPQEEEAVLAAILLHDIGHGPFSHAMEHSLVQKIPHETMSLLMMKELNSQFNGRLSLAISIFNGSYKRRFLTELISGQMDMDRMDYLRRDSFFTGVIEGEVGSDRIIHMLNVSDDMLVVDEKGIYSVEKFLIARRLMYWQVYNHRTVLSAENLLINLLQRAREVSSRGEILFASPALEFFLKPHLFDTPDIETKEIIAHFTSLDESDILSATKVWISHPDKVLSDLSRRFVNRDLLAIELQNDPFTKSRISGMKKMAGDLLGLRRDEVNFYVYTGEVYNQAYAPGKVEVRILLKNGEIRDITTVSDIFDHKALSEKVTKFFLCYPKECRNN